MRARARAPATRRKRARSASIGGKNIMFDCGNGARRATRFASAPADVRRRRAGMHMGYQDERRFPGRLRAACVERRGGVCASARCADFSYITKTNNFDDVIDCVIISHLCGRRRAACCGGPPPPSAARLSGVGVIARQPPGPLRRAAALYRNLRVPCAFGVAHTHTHTHTHLSLIHI